MVTAASDTTIKSREQGASRQGVVTIRDFDQGIVETMGGQIIGDHYYLVLPNVEAAPGEPGVVITYTQPEDLFQTYKLPVITVSRDDIAPAQQRWHPGTVTYRTPAEGAIKIGTGAKAWSKFEEGQQATPFDLTYTINIFGKSRSGRSASNTMLHHLMKVWQPYCRVLVTDSLGDLRSYEAFMNGVSPLDEVTEVAERVIGFSINLMVEAELDLNDPTTHQAVTGANFNYRKR